MMMPRWVWLVLGVVRLALGWIFAGRPIRPAGRRDTIRPGEGHSRAETGPEGPKPKP